jgi:tetratricopeptide (TPR) repeat protein
MATTGSTRAVPPVPKAELTQPDSQIDRLLEKAAKTLSLVQMGGPDIQRRLDEAKVYIDAAGKLDSKNPRYLIHRSRWHYVSAVSNRDPEENVAAGWKLVLEAVMIDDNLPDLHVHMSKVALYFEDDFPAADRSARKAVELAPHDYENHRMLSIVHKINGHMDESIGSAKRATELAPEVPIVWNSLGDTLLAAGRNAEAVIALQRAISLQAAYVPALERLELARIRLGEMDYAVETRVTRLKILKLRERAERLEAEAREVGAEEARRRDIQRDLDDMLKQAETPDPFNKFVIGRNLSDRIVNAYTELGQWSEAMTWVERAYEHQPGRLRRILTDQPFDRRGLAADARYARLLRVAGLEELL